MRRSGIALALFVLLVPAAHAAPDAGHRDNPELDGSQQPDKCAPTNEMKGDVSLAYEAACNFFTAVTSRDVAAAVKLIHAPFYFENRMVPGLEDSERRWVQLLADTGRTPATLYSVDVMSYDDMVKKYGKPPAKLESVPLRGAMMAVANIDGRAAVAALKRDGNSWMVFAYHD